MRKKLIVDAHDVHAVTNYSLGHCRRILRNIKELKQKAKHQKVTLMELSEYLGINSDELLTTLK